MIWNALTGVSDQDLAEANLVTHQAMQLVGVAVGRSLVTPRDDDSHTSLSFDPDLGGWWSDSLTESTGVRVGLRGGDLALVLGVPSGGEFPLGGRTLRDGLEWLKREVEAQGVPSTEKMSLESHFEIPDHPILQGAAFPSDGEAARRELVSWFRNAAELLELITTGESSAAPIRTWPHHFDIGTLLPDGNGRSVGVGFSPGDQNYPVPYFYVSPYPYPAAEALAELSPPAHWHQEGYVAAILTATHLKRDDAEAIATGFLREAIAASWAALSVTTD